MSRLDDPALRSEIRKEMETTAGWENWYRHVGHDWGKVVIGQTGDLRYAPLAGQTVADMARAKSEDPWDTFFNLVRAGAFALPESMSEENKLLALREEFISFCTDVGPAASQIASHPRAFGSFPRLMSKYVRELGAMSLERAVAQASAAAANAIMAYDRGRIAEGLAADIVVFDYARLADRATFAKASEPSVGMKDVLVNGVLVLDNGQITGRRPGRVLRGPGVGKAPRVP
jgi:N-acyl-D-amino-acid deacylase